MFYVRTNKNVMFRRQIAKHERRQRLIKEIKDRRRKAVRQGQAQKKSKPTVLVPFEENDPMPLSSPQLHYDMSQTRRFPLNIDDLQEENRHDPAFKVSTA